LAQPVALGWQLSVKSPALALFLEQFKAAAAEGAVVELKLRLLAGTEGVFAHTLSMDEGGVYGWFLEAGCAGDFQKASDAFKRTGAIVDKLANF
jgi:hypothetical protein